MEPDVRLQPVLVLIPRLRRRHAGDSPEGPGKIVYTGKAASNADLR